MTFQGISLLGLGLHALGI